MSKALLELKAINLKNRNDATAAEIAEHMGEDTDFDHRIAGLPKQRFAEIINAYKKRIEKEDKNDKAEYLTAFKDKVFLDADDHYYVFSSINEILIEALQHGSFKIPGEKSCHERAQKAKADLLLCLAEMGSLHTETLSGIVIEETAGRTLDEFIDSKRAATMEGFISRQIKPSKYRLDGIFSRIKKSVKTRHSEFIRRNARAVKKGERTLTTDDMINMCKRQLQEDIKGYSKALVRWMTGRKEHCLKTEYISSLSRMNKILTKN